MSATMLRYAALRHGLRCAALPLRAPALGGARCFSARAGPSAAGPSAAKPLTTAAISPSSSALAGAGAVNPLSLLGMYAELSKSRLSGLVVMTTAAGYMLAPGAVCPVSLATALGGTFLCSASANTCNQLIETRPDALMQRTKNRPLPSGRISTEHAAAFAVTTGAVGVGSLALNTNLTTALLGVGTIALYAGVYTPMKRLTPMNTWVGAVVGAIPPLMGWTAAGGGLVSMEAGALAASLFLWQIPHFMALAWMYRADYEAGGYHMVPLKDPTGTLTAAICLEYSIYLTMLPFGCWASGLTSCMFPIEGLGFNGLMVFAAWRFAQNAKRGQADARRLFLTSLLYLPAFFFCFLLHYQGKQEADAMTMMDRLRAQGAARRPQPTPRTPRGDGEPASTPAPTLPRRSPDLRARAVRAPARRRRRRDGRRAGCGRRRALPSGARADGAGRDRSAATAAGAATMTRERRV
jgi:protoheme IX farnesyltransferase